MSALLYGTLINDEQVLHFEVNRFGACKVISPAIPQKNVCVVYISNNSGSARQRIRERPFLSQFWLTRVEIIMRRFLAQFHRAKSALHPMRTSPARSLRSKQGRPDMPT